MCGKPRNLELTLTLWRPPKSVRVNLSGFPVRARHTKHESQRCQTRSGGGLFPTQSGDRRGGTLAHLVRVMSSSTRQCTESPPEVVRLRSRPMGKGGHKKGSHHLPKVGTPQEERYEQHMEREAILENFGVHPGSTPPIVKWIVVAVILVLAIGGAISLALLA